MILQAKLDIGETSGCQGSKMIILNKGMTLDKKGFYSKKQGEMQVCFPELFTDASNIRL